MDQPTDDYPDLESSSPTPTTYSPLLTLDDGVPLPSVPSLWNTRILALAIASALLLALCTLLSSASRERSVTSSSLMDESWRTSLPAKGAFGRGVEEGVSDKSSGADREGDHDHFPWTDEMLQWQRTAYHYQPKKNWMNDPNGPLYYKGWYHLFYQYNPDAAVWGNITWGHAVSRDLIRWQDLPIALARDQWYDINGVWTGSATLLPDGRVIMLYTGSTNKSIQVQNLAYPANLSDPLLLEWVKSTSNPILLPPPGIDPYDFRDPTTAWYVPSNSTWRFTIGSKNTKRSGVALLYSTKDFISYDFLPGVLHEVPGTGMWECVDFYPVATEGEEGLDTSAASGPGVRHVLKASFDDDRHDYYAIGTYDAKNDTWRPDDPEADVGNGLRYDYGIFYASKTFYDHERKRRVLWGWIGEADSEQTDVKKGWSSIQSIPRRVWFDEKTKRSLVQWPVEEVEDLRTSSTDFGSVGVGAGEVAALDVGKASQLDIVAEFEVPKETLEAAAENDVDYKCGKSGGAAGRGALGPFGLLVLADSNLTEQTAVYFYIAKGEHGKLTTFICHDELRSSKAKDVYTGVYGSRVSVLNGEKLSVRILVDHSIVETFAQGGRTCITSRVYPTVAIHSKARLFLFNNATSTNVTATMVKAWEVSMETSSATIARYPCFMFVLTLLFFILKNY